MNIEALAFKGRKTLANLNAIDLLDIIEFLQNDRNQWIYQFTKTYNRSVEIQEENQELKKQLEEINKMIEKCRFANIEQVMLNYCGLLKQQKEFINYLEKEIKTLEKDILETIDDMDIYMKQVKSLIIEEILQKYKEIIGK